jgi:hypothetical protein
MNPRVAIVLETIGTANLEFDIRESFAKQLSDSMLVRESAAVVAQALEGDITKVVACVTRGTAETFPYGARISSHNEYRRRIREGQAPSDASQEESLSQTCVHPVPHLRW